MPKLSLREYTTDWETKDIERREANRKEIWRDVYTATILQLG